MDATAFTYTARLDRRRRAFEVMDAQGAVVGRIERVGFFGHASTLLFGGRTVTIERRSFWRDGWNITESATVIGSVHLGFGWRITITLRSEGIAWSLRLHRRGLFNGHYELTDDQGSPLLRLRSRFDWRRFSRIYQVEQMVPDTAPGTVLLLALVSIWTVDVRRRRAAAGAAA